MPVTIIHRERDFCYLNECNYNVPDEGSSGAETLNDKIITIKFKVGCYGISKVYKRSLDNFLIGVSIVAASGLPMTVLTVRVSLR